MSTQNPFQSPVNHPQEYNAPDHSDDKAWHAFVMAGLFAGLPMGYGIYGLIHNSLYTMALPPGEVGCGTANLGFVILLFPIGPILGGIGAFIGRRL